MSARNDCLAETTKDAHFPIVRSVPGPVTGDFTKFLVGRDAQAIARFEPSVNPGDKAIAAAIEKALAVEP